MRYPELLRRGDTIGVCAPSGGVDANISARLDGAIANVSALGYAVRETPSVRGQSKCVSADAATRAAEFMSLYENPGGAAIIPPWGGEFLMDMLPLLDFDALRTLPPKWICGYSDITTLTFAVTTLCDIATVHGSNFMNMGYAHIHETDLRLFDAISKPEFTQKSYETYGGYSGWDISKEPYALTEKSVWKALCGEDEIALQGRVIGGCMDVLCKLIGTRFDGVNAFLERYRGDGFIWTLESCEMSAAEIYRTLWQMRESGWFRYCNGFLIGRPDGYSDTRDFTLRDALEQGLGGLDVPVIFDADIGHIPPQIQLINGAAVSVDYSRGEAEIRQKSLE